MNFTKKELHFLTEAYGCKVSQRKSKGEIGTVLSQKLQQSSQIPNPEILSAIQLCTTSSGLDSTSIRNRPPPSEQTINEPSPSEEMSIIEPSTFDEDVCLSEPSCSEEACTSHQNISDTGEVNVLSEHSSANTKSVKQTRKTKSSGRKKGQRKKSKRRKTSEDIADKQDLCGICSKSKKEDEDWICCDLCSIWYHRECVGLEDEEWIMFSDAAALYTCPMCL